MISPVAGLRPVRAACDFTSSVPRPLMRIRAPACRWVVIALTKSASSNWACFFGRAWVSPSCSNTAFRVITGAATALAAGATDFDLATLAGVFAIGFLATGFAADFLTGAFAAGAGRVAIEYDSHSVEHARNHAYRLCRKGFPPPHDDDRRIVGRGDRCADPTGSERRLEKPPPMVYNR